MRRWMLAVALLATLGPRGAAAEPLDAVLWVPPADGASQSAAKVIRDQAYYSIKLRSVYASYESGLLSDVNRLVVSSQTLSADPGYIGRSTIIHKLWQRADRRGDVVPLDDYLVAPSAAVASEVVIKIGLRGAADDDAYKPIFESLADAPLKATLGLTPATAPSVAALSLGLEKFLAPPFLATEGRQELSLQRTLHIEEESEDRNPNLRPVGIKDEPLREGYLVIVSSKEAPSPALEKLKALAPKDLRISPKQAVEYKDGSAWKPFRGNSYVVLSVNQTPFRGEDATAPWAAKYAEVVKLATQSSDASEIAARWREATALLAADANYTPAERDAIKALRYQQVHEAQGARSNATLDPKTLEVPIDFVNLARRYKEQGLRAAAQLVIEAKDEKQKPRPGIYSRLVELDAPTFSREGRTGPDGLFTFNGLVPGKYVFETWLGGDQPEKRILVFEPKEAKRIMFTVPTVYFNPK